MAKKKYVTVGDIVEPGITSLLYWSPFIFGCLHMSQSSQLFLSGDYTLAYWSVCFGFLLMFFQVVMILVVDRKVKESKVLK